MNALANKVAIVTGAASGIGAAIAKLFAKEGANVVVSDINIEHAKAIAKDIKAEGGKAFAIETNVANAADTNALIDQTIEEFGTVDILVNNAGIMDNFLPAETVTDELWDKVMAVNVTGVMRTIRRAMPVFLKKEKGVIINIASVGGLYGSRAGIAYTASKHAVVGLTKNIGYQYAVKGIRCNAIAPGGVETSIGTTITAPDAFGMERAMSGMGLNPRPGKPEELAAAALFLASDAASFINGACLTADAGWTAY